MLDQKLQSEEHLNFDFPEALLETVNGTLEHTQDIILIISILQQ